jgi:hypothetical protein
MSARQYRPYSTKINNKPLIIYPVRDENPLQEVFDKSDLESINNHLKNLYKKFKNKLSQGSYHIIFVWNLESQRMTDVWIYDMKDWSGNSGPILECLTFRELEECNNAGIASGDSIIALGREEELRRISRDLEEYLDRSKEQPEFPEGMQPEGDYFSQ